MIIVEGIDGTGKTTLVGELKKLGMTIPNYNYDKNTQSFATKYFNIILKTGNEYCSDRSFISEVAKGEIVRGLCRLPYDDYERLLAYYASFGTKVVYLKADKETLLQRRKDDPEDLEMLENHFEAIDKRYDEVMLTAKKYLPVYEFDTAVNNPDQILEQLKNLGTLSFNSESSEDRNILHSTSLDAPDNELE